jgi:hypothetical protein
MTSPKGKLHFPKYVDPKHLVRGDISYRREDESTKDWEKFIYAGDEWLPYKVASASLIMLGDKRAGLHSHTTVARTQGLY